MRKQKFISLSLSLAIGAFVMLLRAGPSAAVPIQVSIENLSPENGIYLTPVWVGFHDGTFDIYDNNQPASESLERLAEDGNADPLSDAFAASGAGSVQGVITGPSGPIAPGETGIMVFDLDGTSEDNRFFNYAAMVIPSNDAFIANQNPRMLFNPNGKFLGFQETVRGTHVLDAGTEVNTEAPGDTAFFGQTAPDTGIDEDGVVRNHPGFLDFGEGGILDDPMFAEADFRGPGFEVARVEVTVVPEPGTLLLLGAGLLGLFGIGRRKSG